MVLRRRVVIAGWELARWLRCGQSGIALVTAMLAIFILTIVVAALVLATMGETGLSFDQSRSGQAIHLAEAGAYRALAELRHRISGDLDANIRSADPLIVQGYCTSNQGWRIVAGYGGPGWVDDTANRRAVLALGSPAAPVEVRDPSGILQGSFYATIHVRPADNQTGPSNQAHVCVSSGVESYRIWCDYFLVATGVTRNARRTVCLKNPGNLANCGEWLASTAPGATAFDTPPATHGFEVLITTAASPPFFPLTNQYTAPRFPRLNPDRLYDRPLWEELTTP